MDKEFIYNFSAEPTGTHMLLLGQVAPNSKVLDIGCAAGYLGKYLAVEKQCEMWGIEPDKDAVEMAKQNSYKFLLNKNIEEALHDPALAGQEFDYILLGDVLEHLLYPERILELLKILIRKNGKLLVSLPNVAHYSVRFSLLKGKWDMKDSGIMDRTHLHFYTVKTAKALLEKQGWKVEAIRPRGDLERWFRKIGLEKIGQKVLFLFPEFFSIQFIFTASLK
ncbi:MAG: methyltransferase domain-containing protein [Candidatus Magasanikbacteria bacterium]|nr:methyltransferase domain-containing protein [Candidatus Magasanikbacteria bacterium]